MLMVIKICYLETKTPLKDLKMQLEEMIILLKVVKTQSLVIKMLFLMEIKIKSMDPKILLRTEIIT